MHPAEEILVAVASGQADLPHRVLVEGHLDACAACRATLAELSAPGGVLLASLAPERPADRLAACRGQPAPPHLSPAARPGRGRPPARRSPPAGGSPPRAHPQPAP